MEEALARTRLAVNEAFTMLAKAPVLGRIRLELGVAREALPREELGRLRMAEHREARASPSRSFDQISGCEITCCTSR